MNCLNNSVSSLITDVITRTRALACSMRAFCLCEFFWAIFVGRVLSYAGGNCFCDEGPHAVRGFPWDISKVIVEN